MEINSYDLVQLIVGLLLDDKNREAMEAELYNEISQLKGESAIRSALFELCKKLEKVEENKMEIKNLSQLKKVISEGHEFVIKKHRVSDFIGQRRKGNVIQTNAVYLIVPDEPENKINQANGGRGSWLEYGKASAWEFNDGYCTLFNGEHKPENLVMSFVFE